MLKKHFHKMLLLFTTLGITSLQAAHLLQVDEGKNNAQETGPKPLVGYYDYTLKSSKRSIDNSIHPDELEDEKKYLKKNDIAENLHNKKDAICFMLIVSDKQTKALSKFFFFNRNPNTEIQAIKKVQNLFRCHTITHTQLNLSPHIIFQVLGWLAQTQNKYVPLFIHASTPVCVTCNAISSSFFNLTIHSSAKGCNGANSIDLKGACPLAQQYIQRKLTLPLAKKLLLPTLNLIYEHKLQLLKSKHNKLEQNFLQTNEKTQKLLLAKNKQIKKLQRLLKDRASLACSLLNEDNSGIKSGVKSVAITTDNKYIVSGDDDNMVRIWELKTGKEVSYSPLKGHKRGVYSVAITKDNNYIVSGSSTGFIRIWSFKTGKELSYSPLKSPRDYWINSVAISSDNQYIVAGSSENTIHVFDFPTGEPLHYSPLRVNKALIYSVVITSDNKYIISGDLDSNIRIWRLSTGTELKQSPLKGHERSVCSVAITKDNKYIVSGSCDKTIRIWDFKTGKPVGSPLKGHTSHIESVAITNDQAFIVSGCQDNTIRIWNFNTGKELPYSPLETHTDDVMSVAVTSDNRHIVSGSMDGTIRIWDWKLLTHLIPAEHIAKEKQKENSNVDNKVFDID